MLEILSQGFKAFSPNNKAQSPENMADFIFGRELEPKTFCQTSIVRPICQDDINMLFARKQLILRMSFFYIYEFLVSLRIRSWPTDLKN